MKGAKISAAGSTHQMATRRRAGHRPGQMRQSSQAPMPAATTTALVFCQHIRPISAPEASSKRRSGGDPRRPAAVARQSRVRAAA
jgi:hypothetical protein